MKLSPASTIQTNSPGRPSRTAGQAWFVEIRTHQSSGELIQDGTLFSGGHRVHELLVRLGPIHTLQKELDGFRGRHIGEKISEQIDTIQFVCGKEELFLTCARSVDVNRRERPSVTHLRVEPGHSEHRQFEAPFGVLLRVPGSPLRGGGRAQPLG